MSFQSSCATCRSLRRFLFSFGMGVGLMYYMTSGMPDESSDAKAVQAVLAVVTIVTGLSIWFRVRQMRAKWRR